MENLQFLEALEQALPHPTVPLQRGESQGRPGTVQYLQAKTLLYLCARRDHGDMDGIP